VLNEGFLGTAASRPADHVLLHEICMRVGLLIGALLARMRRFRLQAWCQSVIVLLNLALIVLTMFPRFAFTSFSGFQQSSAGRVSEDRSIDPRPLRSGNDAQHLHACNP
jgi:hypothetical protein